MIEFPGSKINLGLNITHRLDNGYHALESIFIPTGYSDILEIISSDEDESQFHFSGLFIDSPLGHNLIYKAWQAIDKMQKLPAIRAYLHKVVPMGAGMGGGSADASAMLMMLNDAFSLDLSEEKLLELSLGLGADCPFFIKDSVQYVRGVGEELQDIELDLQGLYLKVICPGIHINTGKAFSMITPKPAERSLLEIVNEIRIEDWKDHIKNDFEAYVFSSYPELADIKSKLYENGAIYASMTGSGSAIYGIFDKDPSAIKIADHPDFDQKL